MSRLLFKCLAVSISVVVMANLTIGTYFEHYESIVNALVVGEFSAPMDGTFFVPVWFMAFALFSHVTHALGSPHVYAVFMSLFTVITLTAFLYGFHLLLERRVGRSVRLLFMAMFLLLYLDNVVLIHNRRISFFAIMAAAVLFEALRENARPLHHYLAVALLCAIGLLARLEVALIAAGVLFVGALLFRGRASIIASGVLLTLCASVLAFYVHWQKVHYPKSALILQAEQEFDDRFTVSPHDFEDAESRLIVGAMYRYVQDDPVFGPDDYRRLVCNQSLWQYLTGPRLAPAYISKLRLLWEELHDYRWLLLCAALLAAMAVVFLAREGQRISAQRIRWMLMLAAVLAVPLAVNLVSTTPHSFSVSLLILVCTGSLWLIAHHASDRAGGAMVLAALLLAACTAFHGKNIHSQEASKLVRATALRSAMAEAHRQGLHVVMLSGTHYDFYPSRLYTSLYRPRIEHHYVDYFLGSFNFIADHSREFLGGDYTSLLGKLQAVANRDDVVILEASIGSGDDFYGPYMRHFHGKDVSFVPHPTINSVSDEVRALRIVMHDLNSGAPQWMDGISHRR